ncbi:MAG TPA: SPOR domain-containing protein [Steroidobacteraceae bacterium]
MDEQVKARLIGATVLVVIAVVLLPELLSGPKRADDGGDDTGDKRGLRTYTIDLTGGAGAGKSAAPPAVEARETAPRLPTVAPPGPAAGTPQEAPPATDVSAPTVTAPGVVPAKAGPAVTSPEVATKPATPPSTTQVSKPVPAVVAESPSPAGAGAAPAAKGAWAVQVGAFGSADTARKLVADLKRDGFAAYVAPLTRSGKTLHRVRVGPQRDRADADTLAARLKARGLPASVVAAN